jgi:hypothetical protein
MGRHSTSGESLAVVGQADKAKISAEMAAHHGVESVDVLRAVFGAPMQRMWRSWCRHGIRSMAVCGRARRRSAGGFLDRLLLGLGALDLPPAVRRWLPSTRSCLTSGLAGAAELEHLDVARAGHAVFVKAFSFSGMGRHSTSSLPMCWMGRRSARRTVVDRSARGRAVVAENADLDQAMGIECGVHFLLNGGVRPSPPIRTTGSRWWAWRGVPGARGVNSIWGIPVLSRLREFSMKKNQKQEGQ